LYEDSTNDVVPMSEDDVEGVVFPVSILIELSASSSCTTISAVPFNTDESIIAVDGNVNFKLELNFLGNVVLCSGELEDGGD
jgi:hypothetical protein